MATVAALYARVSSEKQAQANTIDSQIAALEKRIQDDGFILLNEFKFIDNGYSGSNIIRPGLEKLRDSVFSGEVDKIYIHSPDRLSRKYAYQMILLEEFQNAGVEIIFLNYQGNDSPESHLLLQMQGMIAVIYTAILHLWGFLVITPSRYLITCLQLINLMLQIYLDKKLKISLLKI